jgi:CRISPR/Cas system-associated exonuclease Cas4 (RecB family)
LNRWLTCSLLYKLEYIDQKEPALLSSNLILGTGIHFGHQIFYESLAANGGVPCLKDVQEAVVEEIRMRARVSPPIKYSNGGDLDALIREAEVLTETMYRALPREQVIAVNHEETVPIVDEDGVTLDKPLKVVYDLVVASKNGGEVIVDLKTAKQAFSPEKLRWDLQPTCYLVARGASNGHKPLSFRYDAILKKKKPEFVQYPAFRGPDDRKRLVAVIKAVERGIRHGVFVPNRGSMSCHSCGYEQECSTWCG